MRSTFDIGASPHLTSDNASLYQLGINARCRRRRDLVLIGKLALRKETFTGLQATGQDIRSQIVGDAAILARFGHGRTPLLIYVQLLPCSEIAPNAMSMDRRQST